MVNYGKSCIYKLCCKDPEVKEIYVGSTTNFSRRKAQHKVSCNNQNSLKYDYNVYQFIRETGNFENWDMVELEKCSVKDKKELHTRERYFLESLNAQLNKNIPTRTRLEYCETNKEWIAEKKKTYHEANKEQIAEKYKIYRESNREAFVERQKVYCEANKVMIAEKNKVKVTCECGSEIGIYELSRHKKSQKHRKYESTIK